MYATSSLRKKEINSREEEREYGFNNVNNIILKIKITKKTYNKA